MTSCPQANLLTYWLFKVCVDQRLLTLKWVGQTKDRVSSRVVSFIQADESRREIWEFLRGAKAFEHAHGNISWEVRKKILATSAKIQSIISFSFISLFFLLMITIQPALATEMDSDNYHIETGGFSMTSGSKNSAKFTVNDIVGSTTGSFDSEGFVIQTGLSYLSGNNPFTFSLSSTSVDFGTLTPNHPQVKTIDALVSNGSSAGYKVLVAQQLPLTSVGKATIPDTSCDTPGTPCTNNKSGVWIKTSTYGFGINLTGKSVTADFRDTSYYRPLSNLSKGQSPTLIMISEHHNATDQASVNLKVNVSSTQPVGNYQNNLYFVALPGY